MSCYKGFAPIYDALMADAPYDIWVAYIDGFLTDWFSSKENKETKPIVLDLACGTGSITLRLSKLGYDMIGVDMSEDMLSEASHKALDEGEKILFIKQDMRQLDLYGTVDAVISVCDGMNYILTEEDLLVVFQRVNLFLEAGGVFLFDMNTEYKFKEHLGNNTFEGKGAGGEAYVWENRYDADSKVNEYDVLFYSMDGNLRFSELHKQRAYAPGLVNKLLLEAGFVSVKMRHGYTGKPLQADSVRILYIASK